MFDPNCFLARHGTYERGQMPSCDGRLIKAHLIPQHVLRKELPQEEVDELIWDQDVWVWACGGPMGNSGHHGAFDVSRRLRLPRSAIPPATEVFADYYGLTWFLDRAYR